MEFPPEVVDGINQTVTYLSDINRFVVFASSLGWTAVTLLTYAIVVLLRTAITQANPNAAQANNTLIAASRVAWEGSFVAWGIYFGFTAGWNTSDSATWELYGVGGVLGMLISGGAATAISQKLKLISDVFDNWKRMTIYIVGGPLIFMLMAILSNLVANKQIETIKAGLILIMLITVTTLTAMKMAAGTRENLAKSDTDKPPSQS